MVIANRDEVRQLSGNRLPATLPDSVIDEQILASDTIVNLFTSKWDWTAADVEWPALKQASELIASSYVRQRFKESKTESEMQYKEGINLLELINRRSEAAGKREVVIKRRPYASFPLNPSGSYRSTIHKRDFKVGGDGEGVADFGPGFYF